MHVLFIHDAFPAQFGRLALELSTRHGWRCSFLVRSLTSCPTPTDAMLQAVELHPIPSPPGRPPREETPWPQVHGRFLEECAEVYEALRARPELRPDLVVAHGGGGAPSVFLRDLAACPIVTYCEYYFATRRSDLTYRVDLPPAEPAPFFPRCMNAPTLLGLVEANAGYAPTAWQKQSFPRRFHPKIEVHFDGVDAELYAPGSRTDAIGGASIPAGTKVVTFVARGLESVRGFDVFMQVAGRIARRRPDVVFVVVGGDETHYGWDRLHTGAPSFKQWVLERDEYDLSRFLFLGRVTPEGLAEILRRTDLHLYLSVPFVTSWSLFNAMSSGAVVLASDVEPVRELIEPGVNGLVEPLFDLDRLTETALRVLDDPAAHSPLGRAARRTIEERYSVDVCIPPLRDFFTRAAEGRAGSEGS